MLELKDFFHLPEVDTLFEEIANDGPGLVLVAGLEPRPLPGLTTSASFLPSGRAAIFGILARQVLAAHARTHAVVVGESEDVLRVPDRYRRRVKQAVREAALPRAEQIANALDRRTDMLVVDKLTPDVVPAIVQAVLSGIRVLTQIDCVFSGAAVARHVAEIAAGDGVLRNLRWIVTVQRTPTLCPDCKTPAEIAPERLTELRRIYSAKLGEAAFARTTGCKTCSGTGRHGDVIAFDVFRATATPPQLFADTSVLPMEEYLVRLAALGHISLDDVARHEAEQHQRTYRLLTASEQALSTANSELEQRLAELQSANRVLRQQTESLVSMQQITHALTSSTRLDHLADQVCRYTRTLCGADRSVLYLLRSDEMAEIIAVDGWDASYVHTRLNGMDVFGPAQGMAIDGGTGPTPFRDAPPGIPRRPRDIEGVELRAGLRVPLVTQNEVVGLLIIQTSARHFTPAQVALVQGFANQAALAIQRTGLIESLREKIDQLTAAQAEIVKKERLERELELARQVQQNLLPRSFPTIPGNAIAACSEAARRVGGDLYDAFTLDAQHLGIVIADVSDKGMAAALYMTLTRSLLLAEARRKLAPRVVLMNVHRLLLELGEPDMFVTVFYGVLDTTTRHLTYVRAGHEHPLLLRAGNVERLQGHGTFLGALDVNQLALSEEHIELAPGDRLVLYTDGLTDALSPAEKALGVEGLTQSVVRHRDLPPDRFCRAVFDDVAAFQGTAEQYDDMAMLVVAVN